jgi:ketosteroid isomerase-like protein
VLHEEALLRRAYAAFNARDVEGALGLMHPDVDWPNVMEGRRAHGRDEVRDYWRRQFERIDSRVEPERFDVAPDGRIAVEVHQVVRSLDGGVIADERVTHVYAFREGLVERMDVASPADAEP